MNIFYLNREKLNYTISINGHVLIKEPFIVENMAIDWARNYVSSFDCSTLKINFEQLPTEAEYFERRKNVKN